MKNPAEQIVKTAIWAYRMYPHDFDLQVVVRNAEAILAMWLDNIERHIDGPLSCTSDQHSIGSVALSSGILSEECGVKIALPHFR